MLVNIEINVGVFFFFFFFEGSPTFRTTNKCLVRYKLVMTKLKALKVIDDRNVRQHSYLRSDNISLPRACRGNAVTDVIYIREKKIL